MGLESHEINAAHTVALSGIICFSRRDVCRSANLVSIPWVLQLQSTKVKGLPRRGLDRLQCCILNGKEHQSLAISPTDYKGVLHIDPRVVKHMVEDLKGAPPYWRERLIISQV